MLAATVANEASGKTHVVVVVGSVVIAVVVVVVAEDAAECCSCDMSALLRVRWLACLLARRHARTHASRDRPFAFVPLTEKFYGGPRGEEAGARRKGPSAHAQLTWPKKQADPPQRPQRAPQRGRHQGTRTLARDSYHHAAHEPPRILRALQTIMQFRHRRRSRRCFRRYKRRSRKAESGAPSSANTAAKHVCTNDPTATYTHIPLSATTTLTISAPSIWVLEIFSRLEVSRLKFLSAELPPFGQ